jgi:hypothetical protein
MYPNQQYPRPGGGTGGSQPPYSQQQQQQPQYGARAGLTGGVPQNMSGPYGSNQGGYGGAGNPYAQGSNPQGGNPYSQGGYGAAGIAGGPGGYPPSGQQPFGSNPYSQSTGSSGAGYPPSQSGGYPPQSGGYPPQSGGYPGQQPPYPSQGGYPGQQPTYPSQGGYPGQQPSYPSQGGYQGNQQSGGAGIGANAGGFAANDPRAQRLNQVIQQHEINQQFAARLHALGNCEIVVLCDDSGSMNAPLQGSNQTRWDELKSVVNVVTDICAVMDANGVDVYFLNREPILNVTNVQNIRHAFNSPPNGMTPLVPAIRRILAAKRSQAYEKKLLLLIATDGAPTNEYGQTDIGTLEAVLRNERTPQTYVTFLACTDDLEAVNYLNNWDKSMHNLDVVDDYRSERAEIQRVRGPSFPFSFGDYVVKALLGSIDPWFDALDER